MRRFGLIAVSTRFCRFQPFQDLKSAGSFQFREHEQREQIRMLDIVRIVARAKDLNGVATFLEEQTPDFDHVLAEIEALYPYAEIIPERSVDQEILPDFAADSCFFRKLHQGLDHNLIPSHKKWSGLAMGRRCACKHVSQPLTDDLIPYIDSRGAFILLDLASRFERNAFEKLIG